MGSESVQFENQSFILTKTVADPGRGDTGAILLVILKIRVKDDSQRWPYRFHVSCSCHTQLLDPLLSIQFRLVVSRCDL